MGSRMTFLPPLATIVARINHAPTDQAQRQARTANLRLRGAAAWMLERRYPEVGQAAGSAQRERGELTIRSKAYERLVARG